MKAVALYDPSPVDIKDLGCQFYLTPDDVGKPTAAACKDSLQELNKAVQVGVLETLPNEVLANYQVCPAGSAHASSIKTGLRPHCDHITSIHCSA